MRFFQKPMIGTLRKRFTWWPTKVLIVTTKMTAVRGAAPIPYLPGVSGNYPQTLSFARHAKKPTGGGTYIPVEHKSINRTDCWLWLEPYLAVYEFQSTGYRQGPVKTGWQPYPLPKQWNVFYEYD